MARPDQPDSDQRGTAILLATGLAVIVSLVAIVLGAFNCIETDTASADTLAFCDGEGTGKLAVYGLLAGLAGGGVAWVLRSPWPARVGAIAAIALALISVFGAGGLGFALVA